MPDAAHIRQVAEPRAGYEAETWWIVEPVLRAWRDDAVPLHEYEAGGDGPRR